MPNAPETDTPSVENFIERWEKAEAAERANYQMFLAELADLIGVPTPTERTRHSINTPSTALSTRRSSILPLKIYECSQEIA